MVFFCDRKGCHGPGDTFPGTQPPKQPPKDPGGRGDRGLSWWLCTTMCIEAAKKAVKCHPSVSGLPCGVMCAYALISGKGGV